MYCLSFVLGQATPHAVRLMHLESVLATVLQDGTAEAHGLGCAVAVAARRASFTVGMEEDVWVLTPAGAVELPLPKICNGPRQARYCGQRVPPWMIRLVCRIRELVPG